MAAQSLNYRKTLRLAMITLWPDKLPPDWHPPTELPSGVRLIVYQLEVSPQTKRSHYQVRNCQSCVIKTSLHADVRGDDELSETDSYHEDSEDGSEAPSECMACRASLRDGRASYSVLFKGRYQGPWCCNCIIRYGMHTWAIIEPHFFWFPQLRHAYGTRQAERPPRRSRNVDGAPVGSGSSTAAPDDVREVPQGLHSVTIGPTSEAGPEPGALLMRTWYWQCLTHGMNRT